MLFSKLERIVREFLSSRFRNCELSEEMRFYDDLGLDSVAYYELLAECENCFRIRFSDRILEEESPTIGGLLEHITRLSPDSG